MDLKIDWELVRKEGRAKIIYIRDDEVMNYCAVRQGMECVRNTVCTYELPEEWVLGGVYPSFERRAFAFVIFSPVFDPVQVGAQLPTMDTRQHLIKITRERIEDDGWKDALKEGK